MWDDLNVRGTPDRGQWRADPRKIGDRRLTAQPDMRPFNELQIPHARHAGCPDGRCT
jgi:hypothetical protein